MSRDDARKQLKGTFNFELDAGQVVVRDELLLKEIANLLTGESAGNYQPGSWAVSSPAGQSRYQGAPA